MKFSKKIYVGKKYKIRWFSWSWFRYKYKIESGQLFFNNVNLVKRLKLDSDIIKNVTKQEVKHKIKKENIENKNLKEKVIDLEKKVSKLVNVNKDLLSLITDINAEIDSNLEKNENNFDLETIKKHFDFQFQLEQERRKEEFKIVNTKYESLLEIISDNIAEKAPFPKILAADFNMNSIMNDAESTNSEKILYSIYYLIRKSVQEKGMSIR